MRTFFSSVRQRLLAFIFCLPLVSPLLLNAQEYTTEGSKLVITRGGENTRDWYITIKISWTKQDKVWIDWNNNGTFDGDDEKANFQAYAISHPVTSKTITIYGDIHTLRLPFNNVVALDLSGNTFIKSLSVNNNLLTELDLSKNRNLETLYCYNNKLEKLTLAENTKIRRIACYTNHIQDQNMWNLINSLPSREGQEKAGKIHIINSALLTSAVFDGYNTCTKKQVAALSKKNWGVYDWKDGENQGENIWEGTPDKDENAYTTALPKITLNSSEQEGEWHLNLYVDTEYRNTCWIDKDGDGKYQKGEELNSFDTSFTLPKKSSSLNLYGNFSALRCQENKLTSLILSEDSKYLKEINIENNQIASLNLQACKDLEYVNCDNNKIAELNLSGLSKLRELHCQFNKMKTLQLGNNLALIKLNCSDNAISSLDLKSASLLSELLCSNNQLTGLDLSENIALRSLYCNNNALGTLDVSANKDLEILYCINTSLKTLDLKNLSLLRVLNCAMNTLSNLDFSKNENVTKLYLYKNKLSQLTLKDKKYLSFVDASDNEIEKLNFTSCEGLITLHCANNKLATIATQSLPNLQTLVCNNNQITLLDMAPLLRLEGANLSYNQIEKLDFSTNTQLKKVYIYRNAIKDLQEVLNSLPKREEMKRGTITICDTKDALEKNVYAQLSLEKAKANFWNIKDYNQGDVVDFIGSTAVEQVKDLEELHYSFDKNSSLLSIYNLPSQAWVQIFTLEGKELVRCYSKSKKVMTLSLPYARSGIYILKVAHRSFKVIL